MAPRRSAARANAGTPSGVVGIGCGSLLALFGAVMIGGTALSFGDKGKPLGDAVMMVLFGVVPLVLGAAWAWRCVAARRKAAREETERKVLTLAMQRGGVITAMQAAAETDLSFDEVKRYLDRLADQGHVDVTPSDQGLAYRFPGAEGTPGGLPGAADAEAPRSPERPEDAGRS